MLWKMLLQRIRGLDNEEKRKIQQKSEEFRAGHLTFKHDFFDRFYKLPCYKKGNQRIRGFNYEEHKIQSRLLDLSNRLDSTNCHGIENVIKSEFNDTEKS